MLNSALYERTQILIGDDGIRSLQNTNIFLAGTGGVGGHCAEALVRAGVGSITIVDYDVVTSSNKNRQLIALDSTIGKSKVEELARRLRDINRHCNIVVLDAFITAEDVEEVLSRQRYDFVVDCIDSVTCKVALLAAAVKLKIRAYSSCGAGGRLDPSLVSIGDLFSTENDGLARACRAALRKHGVGPGDITVVHSSEKGIPPLEPQRQEAGGRDRSMNGTISYMPPLFGLMLASAVLRCAVDPAAHDAEVERRQKRERKEQKRALKKRRKETPPTT
ncbi:ubiquitin-activating enzyme [Leishmania donovani]|nr:ubiquitin-activating enzyme, putative [Leishmania donovani]AYU79128.1 ubiquitin-activating enzyme, putative [Leishmania donovani]TPP52186.1 ThiF family protein [Leishmania donovani]CAJ1989120.1 ubiquitin-activating enzyme [Leishmania donovani]CBZ34435.1 ubiquitin-activating enzyme, putative [Leishmania donovani]VDZ44992.1 ubiquitin-activating_enzyme_putative/GeneDB:LmjF.24.0460 [Leishmania donovani]